MASTCDEHPELQSQERHREHCLHPQEQDQEQEQLSCLAGSEEEYVDSETSREFESQVQDDHTPHVLSLDYSVQQQKNEKETRQLPHQEQRHLELLESSGLESTSLSCPEYLGTTLPPCFSSLKDISI